MSDPTDSRVDRMVAYMTSVGFSVDPNDYHDLFAEIGRAGLLVIDPDAPTERHPQTPRDELAGWLRSAYIANRPLFGEGADLAGFVRLADEVIAVGWQAPVEPHEHQWVDVRDLVTGADMCTVCSAWREDAS